jgi:hypothetical protein
MVAVKQLEEGLGALASLGHYYHLEEGLTHIELTWPRLLFHAEKAPNGRLCLNEFEKFELGTGWFETLEAAQHWDGTQAQFEGRGGVKRDRQALLPLGLGSVKQNPTSNADLIAAWKAKWQKENLGDNPTEKEQNHGL